MKRLGLVLFVAFCMAAACLSCTKGKVKSAATKVQEDVQWEPEAVGDSRDGFGCIDSTAQELGEMQVNTYIGMLPAASGMGIEWKLVLRNRLHSGDGTFHLTLTYKGAENGEDKDFAYTGKFLTLRGIPTDNNATVFQCISQEGEDIFNFLRENEDTITLLNDKFEKAETALNYSLTKVLKN